MRVTDCHLCGSAGSVQFEMCQVCYHDYYQGKTKVFQYLGLRLSGSSSQTEENQGSVTWNGRKNSVDDHTSDRVTTPLLLFF